MNCKNLQFSQHAIRGMFETGISEEEVRTAIASGMTAAEYPDDHPYPSRLVSAAGSRSFLVVISEDTTTETCLIVTVYTLDLDLENKETIMNCVICKTGEMAPGYVTVTLQRSGTVVIVKEVPGDVCQDCGEYYLDEPVAEKIYAQAEEAVKRNVEVEILRYAAY